MQLIKGISIVCVLGVIGYILYLELLVIPDLLVSDIGQVSTLLHILSVLILVVSWGEVRAWLTKKNILTVQKELTLPVTDTIEKLTTGKWHADSNTYAKLIDVGTRMGFAIGKSVNSEVDRDMIKNGINHMFLPAATEAQGQSQDVVNEMRNYMDDLDKRKERLS